jgi:hypothetical protein
MPAGVTGKIASCDIKPVKLKIWKLFSSPKMDSKPNLYVLQDLLYRQDAPSITQLHASHWSSGMIMQDLLIRKMLLPSRNFTRRIGLVA